MLNDLLRDKLNIIASDDLLIRAIRAVFDETVEMEKPDLSITDNASLGGNYRAYELSKQIINKGFVALEGYKLGAKKIKTFNKAL